MALALLGLFACGEGSSSGLLDAGEDFVCGDGIVEPGEECDDGNRVSGDGCSADCRVEVEKLPKDPPEAGACESRDDGDECGDGKICRGGECVVPECSSNGDCDNGLVCDGVERCVAGACARGTAPADGASCGGDRVCLGGACAQTSCTANSDCGAATACRHAGSCDQSTFSCVPGALRAPGTACPGGSCNASGACVPAAPQNRKICKLTGPGTSSAQYGVVATDLGIAVRQPNGQMAYIFGDTFSEACVGCGVWTSPVLLRSEPGLPTGCIHFNSAAGGATAKQILDYEHHADGISTWLPSDAITIGNRMYLHVIANEGLGNVRETRIAYSDDNGENWTLSDAAVWPGHINDHLRQLWTWERGEDGYVYIFATKFISRDRGIILHRVPDDQLLNPAAYQPWRWDGAQWGWGANHEDASLVHDTHYGEMSLRRIQGKWVFVYFNASDYDMSVKILEHGPTSHMYETNPTILIHGSGWHNERDVPPLRAAQLYGGYIHPDSTLDNLHLIVSQWAAPSSWPYRSMHYQVDVSDVR